MSQFLPDCTLGGKLQKIKLKNKVNSSADCSEWMSDFQSDSVKESFVASKSYFYPIVYNNKIFLQSYKTNFF